MRKTFAHMQASNPDEGTINLTPLIDVVFILLIMFILVAPLLEIDRIKLPPSGLNTKNELSSCSDNSLIKIHVFADNSIALNNHSISLEELFSSLKHLQSQNPSIIPELYHDEKAHFGMYQRIKNTLETLGFEEMDVILNPSG